MRWSDHPPLALGAYALAALLALFELAVLWQALHPQVPDNYRAYYIARTTTCLIQSVTGAYTLGTPIDFRVGSDQNRELRPCGWDGPAGNGLHSVGEQSRLRFAIGTPQDLILMLEMTGVELNGAGERQVRLSAGDTPIGYALVAPGVTQAFSFPVPASAIKEGYLDIVLDFPNAINPRGSTANTHWRSVKLVSGRLSPA